MPKSLSLGNGNVLVLLDKYAQVGDFYFPSVGLEDQVGRLEVCKIGVWADDRLSWLDDGSWQISIDYQHQTLASKITALNESLSLKLEFLDIVYNETDIFLREATVTNLADRKRLVKVFLNQQFDLYGSNLGNTAYFEPVNQTIIHYKGRRVLVVGGKFKEQSFEEFSIGLHSIEGKEGTFKDAEDGKLTHNPVEHGSVDSVVGFTLNLEKQDAQAFYYWITAAKGFKEAIALHYYVLEKSPEHLLATTQSFWRAWVNKYDFIFEGLPEKAVELFKKSLLIIRTHVDNQGAIIASGDSEILQYGRDTYSYMWPRDGALTALAMGKAGYFDISKKFFEFCNEVLTDEGYLLHKYLSDKSLGSSWHPWIREGRRELAIQEDETALVLFTLWQHYRLTRDLEFVESIYNSFIKKSAEFMVRYRDNTTKLPLQSYDLWEQKFSISTFTVASVFGALMAASNFAKLLDKKEDEIRYFTAAQEIKKAILSDLYDEDSGCFFKSLERQNDQLIPDLTIDISAPAGIFRFGVLEKDDPRLIKAFEVAEETLTCQTPIGGIARYQGDLYDQVSNETPGNPWIITTLWVYQFQIARAKTRKELDQVKDKLSWVVDRATSAGILSEQVDPFSGRQLSVAPLTWSHAEYVLTIIQYLEKLEELGVGKVCNPVK